MPGAKVTLSNPAAGINVTLTTDASGQFAVRDLPAGDYELVAACRGSQRSPISVKLAAGQNVQGSLTMPLGTLQETITVACAGPSAEVQRRFPGNAVFPMDAGQPKVINAVYQTPIRVGGNVRPPKKITDVKPSCPSAPAGETVVRLTGAHWHRRPGLRGRARIANSRARAAEGVR